MAGHAEGDFLLELEVVVHCVPVELHVGVVGVSNDPGVRGFALEFVEGFVVGEDGERRCERAALAAAFAGAVGSAFRLYLLVAEDGHFELSVGCDQPHDDGLSIEGPVARDEPREALAAAIKELGAVSLVVHVQEVVGQDRVDTIGLDPTVDRVDARFAASLRVA